MYERQLTVEGSYPRMDKWRAARYGIPVKNIPRIEIIEAIDDYVGTRENRGRVVIANPAYRDFDGNIRIERS